MDQARPALESWIVLPVLVAASFLIFLPVLHVGLLSDDHIAVWRSGVHGIPWSGGFFRPLSDLSIELGYMVHGNNASWFRSFNLFVHGFNAWLVFLLYRQWAGGSLMTGAWLAAALFLVYPFHLESIIWIVGRNSALATAFSLIALVTIGSRMNETARIILSTCVYFAGLLCYESVLLLPLLLLPMWRWGGLKFRSALKLALTWILATAFYFLMRRENIGEVTGTYGGAFLGHDPLNYVMNVPKVLARMFLPPQDDPMLLQVLFAGLLVVLIAGTWRLMRSIARDPAGRKPFLLMLSCLAITAILPVFAGVSTRTSESDRFLYMPSVFLVMFISFILIKFITSRWIKIILAGSIVIYFMVFNHLGQRNWFAASEISKRVLSRIPDPPRDGRLIVVGLPDSHRGAFIFRNGFKEAMLLRGYDASNVIEARRHPTDPIMLIDDRSGFELQRMEGDLIYEVEPFQP